MTLDLRILKERGCWTLFFNFPNDSENREIGGKNHEAEHQQENGDRFPEYLKSL
jgi:hypothetical protein